MKKKQLRKKIKRLKKYCDRLECDIEDAKCFIFNITPDNATIDICDDLDKQIWFLWQRTKKA